MRCPECSINQSMVIDTRLRVENNVIYRRRKCLKCKHRWSTLEIADTGLERLSKLKIAMRVFKKQATEILKGMDNE